MPKIIHTADVHLDAPFSLLDVQKAQMRKNELRETFASIVLLAKTEKADIVLIAGDLFDSGFVTKETMSLLVSLFSSVPECRFVIAPGNHDYIWGRSPYRKEGFPKNVYIFDKEQLSCFSFPEIGVDVYGYAFTSEGYAGNPLAEKIMFDRSKINILLAHADVGGRSKYCPLSVSDISKSGFDYIALGHIHQGGKINTAGSTYYAYSGCPEGRSFDECGTKGVIVAEFSKNAGRLNALFTNKRMGKRRFEKMNVDITGVASQEALVVRVKEAIEKEGYGLDVLLRVCLVGRISPEITLRPEKLTAYAFGVFYLEVEDASVPLLDYEELKNDISIRGAFFRELLPMLESENEEERRTAADALRYGLAALDGDDVVDF
ncbi:MAG: DNA repair exonuclease [Ruminococcaceae bacterium]|nr:DNA repair exonuclease [Oscillospiraceae bacterium]